MLRVVLQIRVPFWVPKSSTTPLQQGPSGPDLENDPNVEGVFVLRVEGSLEGGAWSRVEGVGCRGFRV